MTFYTQPPLPLDWPTPRNFGGHKIRRCGEHRTVGPHRAWCFECNEWCYPDKEMACRGCGGECEFCGRLEVSV